MIVYVYTHRWCDVVSYVTLYTVRCIVQHVCYIVQCTLLVQFDLDCLCSEYYYRHTTLQKSITS